MSTEVLTGLGDGHFVHRHMDNRMGILTGPRTHPKCILPGPKGWNLGLHSRAFYNQTIVGTGAVTYYVRVVPINDTYPDLVGDPLRGTPITENTVKATTFSFEAMGPEFPCTGYEVWAGKTPGQLQYQGKIEGRGTTTFTIGTTWDFTEAGAFLDAPTMGPPAFADQVEIYQAEGELGARVFMGGGKKYSDGYAKAGSAGVGLPATLICGTDASSTVGDYSALSDASFGMDIDGKAYDFVDIDINGAAPADMDAVAVVIEDAIQAAQDNYLRSGFGIETDATEWQAVTEGSFQLPIDGVQYRISGMDFSGVSAASVQATMDDVATVIQDRMQAFGIKVAVTWNNDVGRMEFRAGTIAAPIELCKDTDFDEAVTPNHTFEGAWKRSSDAYWYGTDVAGDKRALYIGATAWKSIYQYIGDLRGRDVTVAYVADNCSVAPAGVASFMSMIRDYDGTKDRVEGAIHSTDGSYSDTITLDRSKNWNHVHITVRDPIVIGASAPTFDIDNVSVKVAVGSQVDFDNPGFLEIHDLNAGTDVSDMLAAQAYSAGADRPPLKAVTEHTCIWDGDHFVIKSPDPGDDQRLSKLYTASTGEGTDISGTSYMDGDDTSPTCTYAPGVGPSSSIIVGTGTDWGAWAVGMRLRFLADSKEYLVADVNTAEELELDSTYSGAGLNGYQEYVLLPYDDMVYPSVLGNPFRFNPDDLIRLPTEDADEVKAIRRVVRHVAVFMTHHIWLIEGAEIDSPRLISNVYGTPNVDCCLEYANGLAFFTGSAFMFLQGGRLTNLDPEGRLNDIIGRLSANADYPCGVHDTTEGRDLLKWYVGIDDSNYNNIAVVYDPKGSNWWIYNVHDVSCATILRDENDDGHLVTGSSLSTVGYTGNVPAFTFLHSIDYKNDGASTDGTDQQGIIASQSGPTFTNYGSLELRALGDVADFILVSDACFTVPINGVDYDVGPVDLTGATTLTEVALLLATELRLQYPNSNIQGVSQFVILNGDLTEGADVGYLKPYYPTPNVTDISGVKYLNGRKHITAVVFADSIDYISTITCNDMDGTPAVFGALGNSEEGVFVYICDSNGENGQYRRVEEVSGALLYVNFAFDPAPAAGWYWFLGGIVPSWEKWLDFGSPQHKQRVHSAAISVDPGEAASGNRLFLHSKQDLSDTVRTKHVQALGGTADTVNTIKLMDKPATQHAIKILRPNSVQGFKLEDITITHNPIV